MTYDQYNTSLLNKPFFFYLKNVEIMLVTHNISALTNIAALKLSGMPWPTDLSLMLSIELNFYWSCCRSCFIHLKTWIFESVHHRSFLPASLLFKCSYLFPLLVSLCLSPSLSLSSRCFFFLVLQTRQPVFVQLLQGVFRVYHCNWLVPAQKASVESCIKVLSDVGEYLTVTNQNCT